MDTTDIEMRNVKLSVFDKFPYKDLKKICDAIVDLGYEATFVSNGNVVFEKVKE